MKPVKRPNMVATLKDRRVGRPCRFPGATRFQFVIDPKTLEELNERAEAEQMDRAEIIRKAIRRYLREARSAVA